MALSFNKQKGGNQKSSLNSYKFEDGNQKLRIVGDILARYVYWIEGENGKNIPVECLSFNRDEERFDNVEKDWVKEYNPGLKCGWSYATQAVVPDGDGYKIVVVNLKKKLWEQVMSAAEDLGDPTDHDTGWDIAFSKKKTGPLAFNVEYQLQALKCKARSLNDGEREALKDLKSMDDVMSRPTPETQKEFLDRIRDGAPNENIDDESIEDQFKVGA